jgi:hypothetical protein
LKDKYYELESIPEGKNEVKTCNFITCTLTEESDYEEYPDEEMPELMDVEDSDEEDNNEQQGDMWSKDEEDEWIESKEENWYGDEEDYIEDSNDGILNGLLVFLLDNHYTKQHPCEDAINWEEDTLIFPSDFDGTDFDAQILSFKFSQHTNELLRRCILCQEPFLRKHKYADISLMTYQNP